MLAIVVGLVITTIYFTGVAASYTMVDKVDQSGSRTMLSDELVSVIIYLLSWIGVLMIIVGYLTKKTLDRITDTRKEKEEFFLPDDTRTYDI